VVKAVTSDSCEKPTVDSSQLTGKKKDSFPSNAIVILTAGCFLGVVALEAAAFGGPVHEALHVFAVFPGEMEELAGGHVCRLFSQKGLEAPAHVRALPGFQAIAAGGVPVINQCLKHFLVLREPPAFSNPDPC